MHLKQVVLHNVRSISTLTWEPTDAGAGWHVIIGDNGAGKSGFLRALALALVGPQEAIALRQDWNEWLQRGTDEGSIQVWLQQHSGFDSSVKAGKLRTRFLLGARLEFNRSLDQVKLTRGTNNGEADRHVWGGGAGWFSASYGPFRRFSGGDKDQEKLYYSNPKLARHLSVFGESVALSECLEWLKLLQFKKLENDPEGELIEPVKAFVNQAGFLPHEAHLESITSKGVQFIDGNGREVPVENLSDGYRSILSMTFELIRQLAATYGANKIFDPEDPSKIVVPGVVLIDEIDAHLHPTWQQRVGRWFRDHFPAIQFIVSTHSPLICQAADVGSIFRLARPGTDDVAGMVTGLARDRLLYGNVLDAYGTGAFGEVTTRSPEAMEHLARLAELNQKEMVEGLSEEEGEEQQRLRDILPTAASVNVEDSAA
jgi:hypothetical protein